MIDVAIIEDDAVIRSGLEQFVELQPDLRLVGAYESAEAFLMRDELGPQVILLDIELPGMNGLEAVFHIKEKYPDTQVLMFTVYEDAERIFRALQAGAGGYLLKNTPFVRIRAAIGEVLEGGAPMSPVIAKKVVAYFAGIPPMDEHRTMEGLSTRENEVARALVEGLTYKQVAGELHISTDTVRQHVKNIYRKLQVNSRVQLVREFNKAKPF
ncbi:response regulator transcription factor [Flaviaesturariibacter amylovorans]|uniref:Response regulator transcription factor n=1 Tax=Flaviaesturariibacter amylovorans TaxID=1084520 RepID=A0ABP8GFW0_9BACT